VNGFNVETNPVSGSAIFPFEPVIHSVSQHCHPMS
jgi:hypothetical protein